MKETNKYFSAQRNSTKSYSEECRSAECRGAVLPFCIGKEEMAFGTNPNKGKETDYLL
jgi:hypothetical protein